jgi:hypothetical protein
MSDAHQGTGATPITLRLSIPAAGAFREIGTSIAAKFARTVGCSDAEVARVETDVALAAETVSGDAPPDEGANLDMELSHQSASGLEIRVRRAGGAPAFVRLLPRP